MEVLNAALERHAQTAHVWYGLGAAHLQAENYKEALNAFEQSTLLQSNFDLAWYGKGLALMQTSQFEESIAAFEAAIEANPQGALAWFQKAEALMALARLEEARDAYEQVLKRSQPSYPFYAQAQQKLQELNTSKPDERP
jgi:tetratricopeptide (TPR) repeat protein